MSFSLKVIAILHLGPGNFWKLQNSPFSPSSCLLACSVFPHRRCAVSPAPWRASRPPLLRAGARASLRSFSTALGLALVPPPFATPPRTASRSPPRRRHGGPTAAPQGLISRAHEHYFYLRKLFLSSFRLFRAPTPQNAAAAPLELRRAHPAVDPPPQTCSTHANPTIRSASS